MRRLIWIGMILAWALPSVGHDRDDSRNRVSFQVEAEREVANDWATARLVVVSEGKDPAVIASSVNRRMQEAITSAKRMSEVKAESGSYVTLPVYDDGRVVRWRARQELRLESENVDRLTSLIGELQQESLALENVQFSVKRETRVQIEADLIDEGLAAFRKRASLIAAGMGEDDWALVSLTVGHAGSSPRMLRSRSEASVMSTAAAPAFESGTSRIRVEVSGTIELE